LVDVLMNAVCFVLIGFGGWWKSTSTINLCLPGIISIVV
jgi:hypothetical protein